MIVFGHLKMRRLWLSFHQKKEKGDYHYWSTYVVVGYIGDMEKWNSTDKISERLNFGESKVRNITNNLPFKKI